MDPGGEGVPERPCGRGVRRRAGAGGRGACLDELTKAPARLRRRQALKALRALGTTRVRSTRSARSEPARVTDETRALMVQLFGELGQEHPVTVEYRRKLASALDLTAHEAGADSQ